MQKFWWKNFKGSIASYIVSKHRCVAGRFADFMNGLEMDAINN